MAHLLLLGADRGHASEIRALLRQDGHQVDWLRSVEDWRTRERETRPELIVAAVEAPERLFAARGRKPRGFAAPLLCVQPESGFLRNLTAEERLVDRLTSPYMVDELLGRVDALVRVRSVLTQGAAPPRRARPRGLGRRLRSWISPTLPRDERSRGPYLEVAGRLADWADRRDAFEPGHADRVASFCAMTAEVLGLGEEQTTALLRAALLHDIGKVALPIEMLHQPAPLDEAQRRLIRTHPARGAALLRALDPDEELARVVLYHHECPDGQGYYGKAPEGVPLAARLLAVAEAFDAMTSSLLREQLDPQAALDRLLDLRDEKYSADAVDALCEALRPRGTSIPLSLR